MHGEVVYFFIYDVGAEVDLGRVGAVLDEHPTFEPLEIVKTAPKYVDLPKPLTIRLPPETRDTTLGRITFDAQVRLFAIGAASFSLRVPIHAAALGDLTPYSSLRLVDAEGREQSLERLTRELFERVRDGIRGALKEEYALAVEPEPYVVFALRDASPHDVASLVTKERRAVAGLLAGEPRADRLAPEEVDENLTHWFRYYDDDLAIVDWEAALVVEPAGKWADVLYVIELANIELLELRTYDRYLDTVLEKAYDDLNRFYRRGGLFQSGRDLQQELSEARIDLTRVTEGIHNIGKIYGDWFLAKLHLGLTQRFHTAEWEKTVNQKMTTLNDLYALATHEVEHRRGVVLESMIVLLFIIDLVLIYLVSGG